MIEQEAEPISVEKASFRIPATWVYRSTVCLMILAANVGLIFLNMKFPTKDDIRDAYVSKAEFIQSTQQLAENQKQISINQEIFGKNVIVVNETLIAFRAKLEADARQDKRMDEMEIRTDRQIDEVKRRVERLETNSR